MQFEISVLLVSLLAIAILVFNFRNSKGRNKKVVFIINISLLAVMGGILAISAIDGAVNKAGSEEHEIGSTIFSSLKYNDEDDDYYYFSRSAFLSSDRTIAVPKENAGLPALSRVFRYVRLYVPFDAPQAEEVILPNGKHAFTVSGVVRITPDISMLALRAFIILIPLFALFNIIEFFISLAQFISEIKADKTKNKPADTEK